MYKSRKLEIDLKREISFIINTKIKDPRIGFVTLTDVKLSVDYHYLDVFVSIMGSNEVIKNTMVILKQCDGFIKKNLKERIKLRIMPQIKFIYDKSIDNGIRVTELLEKINKGDI